MSIVPKCMRSGINTSARYKSILSVNGNRTQDRMGNRTGAQFAARHHENARPAVNDDIMLVLLSVFCLNMPLYPHFKCLQ